MEDLECTDLSLEAEIYLRLLGSVVPLKGAAYVAVPITSGSRFLNWYGGRGIQIVGTERYSEEHLRAVIEPNCADAAPRIATLRESISLPLIDPSSFDRPGWSQEDYRSFWASVIRRYAASAIFLEGWQYSSGCAFEFLIATTSNVKTLSEKLEPLSHIEGYELILSAVSEYYHHELNVPVMETVLSKLRFEKRVSEFREDM